MLPREQNELLCRVEGEAAMGQLMRRHWLPICLSEEVAEKDGAPVRARLLGEDLVVFRDTNGKIGVLDEHCPHRGASLVFGRNEECGLRCLYHGWKFDVDGNCLDMSSEPEGASIRKSMRTKAYPAREGGGFVWVWMGPKEGMREFDPPARSLLPFRNGMLNLSAPGVLLPPDRRLFSCSRARARASAIFALPSGLRT